MGFDMLDGLKASLDLHQPGNTHSFTTENIGFGGEFPDVLSAVEKLLIQEEVDIVVGYLHHAHAELVNGTIAASGRLLLALDSGYELPLHDTQQSHVFRVSLNSYIAALQAVRVAMGQGIRNTVTSLSFYDGGYRMPVAFAHAVTWGGSTKGTFVTPLKTADFTLQPLVDHLVAEMPDAVLACFCQEMASQFFEEAAKHEVLRTPKVVGSPFLFEESYLKGVKWPGFSVQGCTTWAKGLAVEANAKAQAHMRAHRKKELNPFSLMAWEAGQLIASCFNETGTTEEHMAALRKVTLETPRGRVVMDTRSHTLLGPVYDVVTAPDDGGFTKVEVLGESQGWPEQVETWFSDVEAGLGEGSSWRNLYCCI
jgi:branched-chain amino acid transport system substrate-binding protein